MASEAQPRGGLWLTIPLQFFFPTPKITFFFNERKIEKLKLKGGVGDEAPQALMNKFLTATTLILDW